MFTHPASGHSNQANVVESDGSFTIWLDDATKDKAVSENCEDFSFDTKLVTDRGTSCEDVGQVAKLLLNNAPESVYGHMRGRASLLRQLRVHDSCHISFDKAMGNDVAHGLLDGSNNYQFFASEDIDRVVQCHCDVFSTLFSVPVCPSIWR